MFLFVERIDMTEHTHEVALDTGTRYDDCRTSFRVFVDVHLIDTSVIMPHIYVVAIHTCDIFVELVSVLRQHLQCIEDIRRTLLHFQHIRHSRHSDLQF